MRSWQTRSGLETRRLGARLAEELEPDGILLLDGDLGAGKTVMAQGVAAGLGVDPKEVQSPTFTLIREHEGEKGRLVHIDLYRLDPEETEALGLEELLAGPGVKVVEWAERLTIPVEEALHLEIRRLGEEDVREIVEVARTTGRRPDQH